MTRQLVHTYRISSTALYRTTAWIKNGIATGSGDVLAWVYNPQITWKGTSVGSTDEVSEVWKVGLSNKDDFDIQGNAVFSSDNKVTLGGL